MKRPSTRRIIFWGVGVAVAVALFFFIRGFVSTWQLTNLPGINVPTQTGPGTSADGTPEPDIEAPSAELPPPWDGASRVTMLVIGLDYRDWEAGSGAPRSDTLLLLTIDPLSQTAGILSIPRDLWVSIPGFGYGRINTAYSLGEAYRLPGGGPGLAVSTIEELLGVSIPYYAQVDFQTFERMIDEIGGVKLEITEHIVLDPIGSGWDHTVVEPGTYTLPGYLALAYARNRKTEGGDVDRARRQQQVIMAIRDRLLEPQSLPRLITRAPALYQELSEGINTNMSLDDALRLIVFAIQLPAGNIKQRVIGYDAVTLGISPEGGDILKPIPDQIRILRDEIFTEGGALSPMAVGDPVALMQAETARVAVLNGTYVGGLAATTSDYLTTQGMNIVEVGNPSEYPGRTILIVRAGKPYTIGYLMTLMHLTSDDIRIQFDPAAEVDVVIILGDDWAYNNPMP